MSATSEYINQLKQDGDFLTLSRNYEWHLDAGQFTLSNNTQVTVHDTGVIEFEPDCITSKNVVLSSAIHGNEKFGAALMKSLHAHFGTNS